MSRRSIATDAAKPTSALASVGVLRRRCDCAGGREPREERLDEPLLRRRGTGERGTDSAPDIVHDVLRGVGRPLEASTRAFFETRFGHDFSRVRVHTGEREDASARAIGASAYTVGNDIVFARGHYAPQSGHGRRLLAHELTHTVQQGQYDGAPPPKLKIGPADDASEREADRAANELYGAEWAPNGNSLEPRLQRDLARPPAGAPAPDVVLTANEVAAAIAFNEQRFRDPYSIALIRDVIGVSRFPAVVDDDFVEAVRQWQAERRMRQDGMVGHAMTRSLFLELVAEGQQRDAIVLLIDSYALPAAPQLQDIRVGAGLGCCSTATVATADAVTFDVGTGTARSICVCRTSIPTGIGGYDHFVRILLHELVHVPQRAAGPANADAREFEAFFAETCAGGRAPHLTPAQRVVHANAAIGHFNAMPVALQTPARIAMRNRLVALVAAGGAGPC